MRYSALAIALPLLGLSACVKEPVEWGDVSYRQSQLGDPDARSAIMSAGLPASARAPAPCIRSIRTAGKAPDLFRTWWASRSDSSVVLSLQHSRDAGSTWDAPVEVGSRDQGRRGCDRPAPGIFYDPASGYLHLVYFVQAAEGPGIFFAHSMDKGKTFHAPVAVVFGNAPAAASVAGIGDSVVVVFEDPNATAPRIGIALSRSAGHIFEQRGQVTPDDVRAIAPWVALKPEKLTVWWKTPDPSGAQYGDRVGSRAGVWR
ncbi:MAG TPA: sialidase family protein [Gemmatimonadaceae bacterium]|nr:sialidase family protein [Gemmatimonadaceae bacterium]